MRNLKRIDLLSGFLHGGSGVPILCYHQVGKESETKHPGIYSVADDFRKQIEWLVKQQYSFITLSELSQLIQDRKGMFTKSVVLTFDDGYEGIYENAFPVLREYGCKALIYVIADKLNDRNFTSYPFLKTEQLQEMTKSGIEIGSHTLTHPDLTVLEPSRLREEIINSKKKLEDVFRVPIKHFCYPFGRHNSSVTHCVQDAGYETATTTVAGRWNTKEDLFALKRITVGFKQTVSNLSYNMHFRSWFP